MSARLARVLHVSDTHLFGDRTRHYGVVDTAAALRALLDRADTLEGVDAVVLSGDLSDDGTPASYERLRRLVDPWAQRHGAVVVPAMGNHDERAGFEAVLGARERTVVVGSVRVVTVDSSVPGVAYGALDERALDRLRAALAGAEDPGDAQVRASLVVVHHPPLPARTPLLAALELADPGALLAVCSESATPVTVLAGHYHHPLVEWREGVPVVVAPGVANTTDALAACGHERGTVGSGFAVVDVLDDGEPGVVVVGVPGAADVADGTELFDLGPDDVARIGAAVGLPATVAASAETVGAGA